MSKGHAHIEMLSSKVLLAGRLISWNLITLTLGSPTSTSHALMGGYGGAAVALPGFLTLIMSGWKLPVLSIFLPPVIGMIVGITVTITTTWIAKDQRPKKVDRWFRRSQFRL
jgi:inorganic phosphate transporter, PiT family